MKKDHLLFKKLVKKLRNKSVIKTLGLYIKSDQFVSCYSPIYRMNSLQKLKINKLKNKLKSKQQDNGN